LKYSVDTSALLDGWRRYYPPDVFPLVWKRLDELIQDNILVASEEVLFELERKDDDVYSWARDRSHMFVPTADEDVQRAVSKILAIHKKLIDERKNRSGADPWVIAVAQLRDCAVLTGEKPTGNIKRPNIPDVCLALGLRWVNMLQLFREQHWIFS
jgi:hypothetical protein